MNDMPASFAIAAFLAIFIGVVLTVTVSPYFFFTIVAYTVIAALYGLYKGWL